MWNIYLQVLWASSTLALYSSSSSVIELTPSNFDKLVIKSDEIWIVEFFAPWCGHCQSLVPEYQKAAKALKGIIKVGAVNADEHNSLGGRYGVKAFPTIKIFGADKQKPEDLNGQRTAQRFVDAAFTAAKTKVNIQLGNKSGGSSGTEKGGDQDVIELTDSNFDKLVLLSKDMWLVEFYAPWCSYCRKLAPHWAQAASELKGKVKVGALDVTQHQSKANEYGVRGYPTIKLFTQSKKSSDSIIDYNGDRLANDIIAFALEKLAENLPAPEITQIIDAQSFKDCCDQKPLCVIAILPHILDCQADCRNGYIKLLKDIGDNYKKNPWGWVWTEAGAQGELERVLDIGGFGYPAMAVVNARKMKYSLMRGSFSKVGINEFLRDLSFGRGYTASVKGAVLPKAIKTELWDGKDGQLPAEDEIDLSDVNLDAKDEL